nr:MAG TPA: hypothetical protein [Caudoviricetes sp.]
MTSVFNFDTINSTDKQYLSDFELPPKRRKDGNYNENKN